MRGHSLLPPGDGETEVKKPQALLGALSTAVAEPGSGFERGPGRQDSDCPRPLPGAV